MGFAVAEDQEFALPPLEERPLVTFALFAYNQEKYIKEAVESALMQTYSPLEIIISDDASYDLTPNIIEDLCSKFDGPHKIKIIKNKKNLGIGNHVNNILKAANGEIVVLGAGDDISKPNRVAAIVNFWLDSNCTFDLIWSDVSLIDETGNEIGEIISQPNEHTIEEQIRKMVPAPIGCANAITRRSFVFYGDLQDGLTYEDRALAFRALCLGGLGHVAEKLVEYRTHSQNTYNISSKTISSKTVKQNFEWYRADIMRKLKVFESFEHDYNTLASNKKQNTKFSDSALRTIIAQKENLAVESKSISPKLHDRFWALSRLLLAKEKTIKRIAKYSLRLLSPLIAYSIESSLKETNRS